MEAVSDANVAQPNFARIAEHHRGLAEELSKCSNLPSVDTGAALAQTLTSIMTELRDMNRSLNRRMDDMDRRMDERFGNLQREMRQGFHDMQLRIKTVDSNNISRLVNSQIVSNTTDLAPLCALQTGDPIEGFPQTPSEIARLSSQQINSILRALEIDTAGTIDAKRQRLRLYLGLKAVPV
ncbi:hypothetical protein L228DRAFT_266905 [Xylona heveae TC161]|uniref:SAP domain-containing protein n=1 Tax=Xylona heveae (strain CBS 132557 / TC161) TaxID=1328760 RepID=A0A165I9E9_XYLHT|nr:hypothetical protein L228DRAFT_266905 [Xylona heveae TC161]KZF24581.1 hypothetical protein L228DRAFT_266905 [Xylona heveae TC161]